MPTHERNVWIVKKWTIVLLVAFAGILTVSQIGCSMLATVAHVVGADMVPAEYDELKNCKLAVVTISDSSQYSDDVSAKMLSRKVSDVLLNNVRVVSLIREEQIEQWRDENGWDTSDFLSIGRGVKAEKVLGIELTNLQLRDGKTMYRGRSDVNLIVIDVESGDVVYRKEIDEYSYPVSAGQHTSETTEVKFRKLYLSMLSRHIGRHFHKYDHTDLFASDGALASQ